MKIKKKSLTKQITLDCLLIWSNNNLNNYSKRNNLMNNKFEI